jgi:hypothetical protein
MKAWFKILSGKTTSTPAEIAGEIDNLKVEQNEVKAKLSETQEALSKARMELYGGSGKQTNVDGLEADVKTLQAQVDTLSRALADLDAKHVEAIAAEKQTLVDAIDAKISDLKNWAQEIRPDYVRAKVMVEAFERLFTAPTMNVGFASTEELWVTGRERAEFQAEVDAITQGHGSIVGEIMDLKKQKKEIMDG